MRRMSVIAIVAGVLAVAVVGTAGCARSGGQVSRQPEKPRRGRASCCPGGGHLRTGTAQVPQHAEREFVPPARL
jgi:hypothetical protein